MENELTEKEIFEALKMVWNDQTELTTDEIDKRLAKEYKAAWLKFGWLKFYLRKEQKGGKTEFRLVINQNGTWMIHPLGKDGETLDFDPVGTSNH